MRDGAEPRTTGTTMALRPGAHVGRPLGAPRRQQPQPGRTPTGSPERAPAPRRPQSERAHSGHPRPPTLAPQAASAAGPPRFRTWVYASGRGARDRRRRRPDAAPAPVAPRARRRPARRARGRAARWSTGWRAGARRWPPVAPGRRPFGAQLRGARGAGRAYRRGPGARPAATDTPSPRPLSRPAKSTTRHGPWGAHARQAAEATEDDAKERAPPAAPEPRNAAPSPPDVASAFAQILLIQIQEVEGRRQPCYTSDRWHDKRGHPRNKG